MGSESLTKGANPYCTTSIVSYLFIPSEPSMVYEGREKRNMINTNDSGMIASKQNPRFFIHRVINAFIAAKSEQRMLLFAWLVVIVGCGWVLDL